MRTAVVVCLLVVLAGCNAPAGDATTETPATTATAAPVPADSTLAPGVTKEGVVDPERLAAAHRGAIRNRSYTLAANRTVRYANGTLRSGLWLRVRLGERRTYRATASTAGSEGPVFLGEPPATAEFWGNGSVYVRRFAHDGEQTYNTFEPVRGAGTWQYWVRTVPFGGGVGSPRRFIGDLFATVPTRLDGTTRNTTAYRLVGDSATGPVEGIDGVSEVRLTAVVRADGLVRSISLQYAGRVDGEPIRVTRRVRYERVGRTTADRPPWFDRAI
jgi:hypothetical protein